VSASTAVSFIEQTALNQTLAGVQTGLTRTAQTAFAVQNANVLTLYRARSAALCSTRGQDLHCPAGVRPLRACGRLLRPLHSGLPKARYEGDQWVKRRQAPPVLSI